MKNCLTANVTFFNQSIVLPVIIIHYILKPKQLSLIQKIPRILKTQGPHSQNFLRQILKILVTFKCFYQVNIYRKLVFYGIYIS